MARIVSLTALLLVFALTQVASAHYLWVVVDRSKDPNVANLYFEGGPGPGNGQYLDPFIDNGKMWLRIADSPKAQELEMKEVKKPGKRWLAAELEESKACAVESYGKWGVYRYGQTDEQLSHLSFVESEGPRFEHSGGEKCEPQIQGRCSQAS